MRVRLGMQTCFRLRLKMKFVRNVQLAALNACMKEAIVQFARLVSSFTSTNALRLALLSLFPMRTITVYTERKRASLGIYSTRSRMNVSYKLRSANEGMC